MITEERSEAIRQEQHKLIAQHYAREATLANLPQVIAELERARELLRWVRDHDVLVGCVAEALRLLGPRP